MRMRMRMIMRMAMNIMRGGGHSGCRWSVSWNNDGIGGKNRCVDGMVDGKVIRRIKGIIRVAHLFKTICSGSRVCSKMRSERRRFDSACGRGVIDDVVTYSIWNRIWIVRSGGIDGVVRWSASRNVVTVSQGIFGRSVGRGIEWRHDIRTGSHTCGKRERAKWNGEIGVRGRIIKKDSEKC